MVEDQVGVLATGLGTKCLVLLHVDDSSDFETNYQCNFNRF